jgi:hypothetical protein
VIKAAASSILAEVFGLVAGLEDVPGFNGNGGGALSGSELSHLQLLLLGLAGHDHILSQKEVDSHRNRSSARFRKGMLMLEHQ